jgi:hypothetical protein
VNLSWGSREKSISLEESKKEGLKKIGNHCERNQK